jgi:hypothetical protein
MPSSLTESAANFLMPSASFSVAMASSLSSHLNFLSSSSIFEMSSACAVKKYTIYNEILNPTFQDLKEIFETVDTNRETFFADILSSLSSLFNIGRVLHLY